MSDPELATRLGEDAELLMQIARDRHVVVGETAQKLSAIGGRMQGIAALMKIRGAVAVAEPLDAGGEIPLAESVNRLEGRTIERVDATACNNVVLHFTDGGKVALHIDCDSMGLPSVETCVNCVDQDA